MAKVWKQGVLGGLALVAGLGLQGCTEDETGLFVYGTLALTAPQCIVRNDPGGVQLPSGLLDINRRDRYEATLLVGNQFTPRGDKQNLRTETMVTTLTGAVVRLYDGQGALVQEFSVPASGVVEPNAGEDPGFGLVDVILVPGVEVDRLLQPDSELPDLSLTRQITRVARVSVFGNTVGGLDVESAEYPFVISVCRGCLPCDGGGVVDLVDSSCRPGQDDLICEEAED